MSMLAQEKGMISLKVMFWLALLFVLLHVLFKVVPMGMDYSQMKDAMQGKVNMGQIATRDLEIKTSLEKTARDLDIPLTQESFIIERNQNTNRLTRISTNGGWDIEMRFLWGAYVRTFHFEPVAE